MPSAFYWPLLVPCAPAGLRRQLTNSLGTVCKRSILYLSHTKVNMRIFLSIISTSMIAGCAISLTPKQLIESGPENVYTSDLSSKVVAQCIVSKWEETRVIGGGAVANLRETDDGHRVTLHIGTDLQYLADISKTKTGSKTKLYVGRILSLGSNPQVGQVASCQ